MCTTFSFSSSPLASMRRTDARAITLPSDLEARFARAFGDRANTSMVEEAVSIEDGRRNALVDAGFSDDLADDLGRRNVGGLLDAALHFGGERRGGEERLAGLVGDQ